MAADGGTPTAQTLYSPPRSVELQAVYQALRSLIDTLNRQVVSGQLGPQNITQIQSDLTAATAALAVTNTAVSALQTTVSGLVVNGDLTPQQAFELSLETAKRDVFGSTKEAADGAFEWAQSAAVAGLQHLAQTYANGAAITVEQQVRQTQDLSLATQITTLNASLATTNANVTSEITARATGDTANASAITTVQTQANGNTASIATIQTSSGGTLTNWGVVVNANGQVTGLISLTGSSSGTTFTVVADKFIVAKPGAPGTVQQVFVVGSVNGTSTVGIDGNLLVDGSILARSISVSTLSALTANLGTVTAGIIQNPAATLIFDLPNMRLYRTDGAADINLSTPEIRMTF